MSPEPLPVSFYARAVTDVARDLVGCTVTHGATAGRIVETEAYHQSEPACHGYTGLTDRTRVLYGPPGRAYVYRSYGIHAMLNAVAEADGTAAGVLIRAIEPLAGEDEMARRRGRSGRRELGSGPGKVAQALGVGLDLHGTALDGPIVFAPPPAGLAEPRIVVGPRVGITKAVDLPWRFCDAGSDCVSAPRPPEMGARRAA